MQRNTILYDRPTIRDAILTCARKPTRDSLIYRTEPTTKSVKKQQQNSFYSVLCISEYFTTEASAQRRKNSISTITIIATVVLGHVENTVEAVPLLDAVVFASSAYAHSFPDCLKLQTL